MAEGKRWYSVTQKNKVNPTDKMLIYDGSASYVVPLSLVKGADNLTNEYVELEGEDGELYRVSVDCNGNPHAIKSSAFTASNPNVDDNTNPIYQALIVNQMYGGGELLEGTAVSHSFIELYNLSKNELNLKGLYLWYKSGTSVWESMELKGIIPPYSSYLIVGAEHNSIYKDTCRLKITEYDAVFKDVNGVPKRFSNKGMSVYISIGNAMPDTNPLRGIADISGNVEPQPAYIDLMGCGGTNPSTDTVGAYEKNYRFGMNKDCACRRIDFYNGGDATDISGYSQGKGDNASDCEIIDYSTCEVEKFRPRCTKDGAWDMFVSKEPINENAPNTFVLGLGEDDTTRTFTWQSKPMKQGFVKYREKGETKFKQVKANTTNIQHPDVAVSRHSAIIKDFEYGKTYEYQVGAEGFWSDLAEFDVRDKRNGEIKILWQSDEQG